MKKILIVLLAISIIAVAGLTIMVVKKGRNQLNNQEVSQAPVSLPSSLDNFFPPKTEQPVYLFKMLEVNKPFTGIVSDLIGNDFENAMENFKKFKGIYLEVSKMVPEWEIYFPSEPLKNLESSMNTNDPGKVMAAIQEVGKVCSDCHARYMPMAQQKYLWGDFKGLKVIDPLTNQEVNNKQFMQFLDASFTGIEVDAEQGQIENARKQFEGFKARFKAMEDMCYNCHDSERHYYVDESIKSMIDRLGQALNETSVDMKTVSQIGMAIGMESCFKCHLVHVPASVAQWNF